MELVESKANCFSTKEKACTSQRMLIMEEGDEEMEVDIFTP
jgi:hypothetical protein